MRREILMSDINPVKPITESWFRYSAYAAFVWLCFYILFSNFWTCHRIRGKSLRADIRFVFAPSSPLIWNSVLSLRPKRQYEYPQYRNSRWCFSYHGSALIPENKPSIESLKSVPASLTKITIPSILPPVFTHFLIVMISFFFQQTVPIRRAVRLLLYGHVVLFSCPLKVRTR